MTTTMHTETPGPSAAEATRTNRIQALNDHFRQTFCGGQVVMTAGIAALSPEDQLAITRAVRTYSGFGANNDPHGEHDFGDLVHKDQKIFFKIDCYDRDCHYGSEDPADPSVTKRVLTILFASEY